MIVPVDIRPLLTIALSTLTLLSVVSTTSLFVMIEPVMVEPEMFELMIAEVSIVDPAVIVEPISAESLT